ncbi:hypothetical protein GCM10009789_77190 [Kribbella sancticallisti]|uniref:DUF3995 domain-containing protein n=1 Tax=Kribbella sancticallisti TaxID=460087 RepID=A0ABP4QHG7_9ACTN
MPHFENDPQWSTAAPSSDPSASLPARSGPGMATRLGSGGPAVTRWTVAAIAWAALFSAVHWYWAFGGRAGLGASTAEADAALQTPLFAAYNLGVAATTAALAAGLWWTRPGRRERIAGRRILLDWVLVAGAILLAARGGLGVCLMILDVVRGEGDHPSLLLVVIEPYFLLGGLILGFTWLARRRPGLGAPRP